MHQAKCVVNLGLAAVLTGAVLTSSVAAPVLTNTAAVKAAVVDDVSQVHWGWGWGAGAFIGGLALGAALAAPPYAHYGYPYGYYGYYGYPYYRPYYRRYYGYYRPYWVYHRPY
jgi:hypothetical protein